MPRDLILHIGLNKTGTTSIQKVMSLRRKDIVAQGMFYPRTPGNEKHVMLAAAAATRGERESGRVWKFSTPAVRLAKFRSEFDAEMRAMPANVRRVILSAEQFSFVLKDEQAIQNLHDLVTPYVDSIVVLVYLRRPDQHLTSLYSEMIRWGDARAPGLSGLRLPAGHGYDYDGLLNRWASVFGEAALKPQIFERQRGEKFDVVQHFLDLCGLKLRIPAKKNAANEALSSSAQLVLVELAKRINNEGKHANVASNAWRMVVEATAAALPGKGWLPTRVEAEAFNSRFAENHERVRAHWFPDRSSLFSTDYSDLPTEQQGLDDRALLDASIRALLQTGEKMKQQEDELAKVRAGMAEQEGNSRRVHRHLAKRIELLPDNVEARVKLARLLAKEGDHAAARRLLDAALKIAPDHADARAASDELGSPEELSAA